MYGDQYDLNQILQWAAGFWNDNVDIDPEVRMELGALCSDLVRSFDTCLKAHVAAYLLGTPKRGIYVSL